MTAVGEIVRATGLCSVCDFKFTNEVVARYPAPSMPGGVAYIELRHLDREELSALRSVPGAIAPIGDPADLDPLPRLAASVRARRKALGLTQEAAAWSVWMDPSYWSKIERGLIDPGVRVLARVATALRTTVSELLAGIV